MIIVDSLIRVNKKCYPQILLEECKYKILDPSSSDEFDNDSENGFDNASDSNESND